MAISLIYIIITFKANHLNTIIYPEIWRARYAVRFPAYSDCQITLVYVTFTPPTLHIPSILQCTYFNHVFNFLDIQHYRVTSSSEN
jgi:hypothetical protein